MRQARRRNGGAEGPPWVTASAVGQAAFCPYQLYLARQGVRPSEEGRRARARGDDDHRSWTRARQAPARRGRRALALAVVALVAVLAALAVALAPLAPPGIAP